MHITIIATTTTETKGIKGSVSGNIQGNVELNKKHYMHADYQMG